MEPGAPILHDKKSVAEQRQLLCRLHGEIGNVAEGFKEADAIHEVTYSTSRVQHVHLETHGSIAWRGDDGRLHVRTSSQAPFIAQKKLAYLFGMFDRATSMSSPSASAAASAASRRWCPRICALLATIKTGRPVMWEFTREEQFIGATTRHQMTTHVKLGAKKDGTLTALRGARRLQHRRLWQSRRRDAGRRARQPDRPPIAARTRRPTATPSIPIWCRAAASEATARRRPPLPSNAPWTSSRSCSASTRSRSGARTSSAPADRIEFDLEGTRPTSSFGSYGIDQCLDPVENAGSRAGEGCPSPRAPTGSKAPASRSPCSNAARRPNIARAPTCSFLPDGTYHLAVGSTEMGNGSSPRTGRSPLESLGYTRRARSPSSTPTPTDAVRHRHLRQHRHGRGRAGRRA